MFYEEKIIEGILYRKTPNSNDEWEEVHSNKAYVISELASISPEQRLEILNYFCSYCGRMMPEDHICDCKYED